MSGVQVTDRPEVGRYEAYLDGDVAGIAAYDRGPDVVVFTHTEVEPAYEGQGVGGRLARVALDAARADGLRVVPRCPFIRAWIERHPDYADLVTDPA